MVVLQPVVLQPLRCSADPLDPLDRGRGFQHIARFAVPRCRGKAPKFQSHRPNETTHLLLSHFWLEGGEGKSGISLTPPPCLINETGRGLPLILHDSSPPSATSYSKGA